MGELIQNYRQKRDRRHAIASKIGLGRFFPDYATKVKTAPRIGSAEGVRFFGSTLPLPTLAREAGRLVSGERSLLFNHLTAPSAEGVRLGGSDIPLPPEAIDPESEAGHED